MDVEPGTIPGKDPFIGQNLRSKGLIDFDQVHISEGHVGFIEGFGYRNTGSFPHVGIFHTNRGISHYREERLNPNALALSLVIRIMLLDPSLRPHELPAVTEPPSIKAGGSLPAFPKMCPGESVRLYRKFLRVFFLSKVSE
jgi:hypothetical protein